MTYVHINVIILNICSQRRYNMIAIPVKTDDINGIVSPTFGKGKYFAIVNHAQEGSIEMNPSTSGIHVVAWLKEKGVKQVIVSHLGEKLFHALIQSEIKVYFAGTERIGVDYILAKLNNHELQEVTIQNYMHLLGHSDPLDDMDHERHHHSHGGGACCIKGTFADWLI